MKKIVNNIKGDFMSKIHCNVDDCSHCNCSNELCNLKEIKVCNCNDDQKKEATMCDSYNKRKDA